MKLFKAAKIVLAPPYPKWRPLYHTWVPLHSLLTKYILLFYLKLNFSVSPTSSENLRVSSNSFSPNVSSQGAVRNSQANQNSPQQLLNSSQQQQQQQQQQHTPVSQTLSDLKKQRSLSRAVHQHQNSQSPDEAEPSSANNKKRNSADKQRSNNNKRESTGSNNSNNTGNRRRGGDDHSNSPGSGPASIDVLKFSAATGEVVGPPKKTSCCKVM